MARDAGDSHAVEVAESCGRLRMPVAGAHGLLAVWLLAAGCVKGSATSPAICPGQSCGADAASDSRRTDGARTPPERPGDGGAEMLDADLGAGAPEDAAVWEVAQAIDTAPDVLPAVAGPLIGFSAASGVFTRPFPLHIVPAADTVTAFATVDGTLPTDALSPVAGPLPVDRSVQVRVLAVESGTGRREMYTATFMQGGDDLVGFGSTLPIMLLHSLAAVEPAPDRHDATAAVMLIARPEAGLSRVTGLLDAVSRVGFKVRGRTSRDFAQRSYTMEMWGAVDGDDRPAPVLGLPPESDWVLHGPFNIDRSLIRNALMYAIGSRLGRYAPRTRFVELFVESVGRPLSLTSYRGVYTLVEKVKRDPQRVNIANLRATDDMLPVLSGGYIFKVDDHLAPGELPLVAGGEKLELEEPEPEAITPAQRAYLTQYLDEMAQAIAAPGGRHPATGRHYSELIDVDSWIDFHIMSVFARNPDALRLSAYYHKDRSGKVVAGPLWDFDRSMGANDFRDSSPQGWSVPGGTNVFEYGWWKPLFADPAFEQRYWQRWETLLAIHLRSDVLGPLVTTLAAEVAPAHARHVARWPQATPEGGYNAEILRLVTWLEARIAWTKANLRVR